MTAHEQAELDAATVVLLGSPNPAIFHPQWFGSQGLVSEVAAREATIQVIHPELTVLTIDDVTIEVTLSRIVFRLTSAPTKDVLDLVAGTLGLLRHTPIHTLGINREQHHKAPSVDAWHAFGHRLVPKETWNGVLESPGLRSLTEEGVRTDGHRGHIRVKVEPSARVPNGIYVHVNDQFEAGEDRAAIRSCDQVLAMLTSEWQHSKERSEKIIDTLLASI